MATGYLGIRNEAKVFRKDYNANQAPTTVYTCSSGYADLFIESMKIDGSVSVLLTIERFIDGTWVETNKISISGSNEFDAFSYSINSNGGYDVTAQTGNVDWTKFGLASTPQVIRLMNADRIQTEVLTLGGGEDADLSFSIIEYNMTVTDITA